MPLSVKLCVSVRALSVGETVVCVRVGVQVGVGASVSVNDGV